ncbi:MAG TPA: DUF5916 domain-containing protein, partial [Candidatus Acidoferrum sp.]|nr:DUF5916 domain-containing protein [Candidatus Acidoferrum sp.]
MNAGRIVAFFVTLFWLVFSFLAARPAAADDGFKAQVKPTLNVTRLTGEIKIDGQLDEPGWTTAAVATGFCETNPGDQVKPPVESKALVTYDQNKLYIALIAWDDPKTIRASMCDRDNIFSDDYFGIMMDTYGDASWAYELFVNPYGIQGDLRQYSNGNEDAGFDIVWESKGIITDSGYQVEIAIPFSSLRFPNTPEQTWRATFWRDRQRDVRRKFAWAALNRDESCFLCQFGTLTGIRDIKPGSNLEFLPNVVASKAGALQDGQDVNSPFINDNAKAEISLNGRYALTSTSSAELTVNPDFSQVESDATQIDVNSPYALYYNERRPFFQEGSDLFSSYITTVYTRAIYSPQVASKLTGKFGRTSVAYLLARDDNTPILIPLAERSAYWHNGKSTSNIVRVKRTFLEDSFLGGFFTDRRLDHGGSGTVMGGDGMVRFSKHYRLSFQALASRTGEPNDTSLTSGADTTTFERGRHTLTYDGETYWGHALYARFDRDARLWNGYVQYQEYSPTFRADNGFVTQNDIRQVYA